MRNECIARARTFGEDVFLELSGTLESQAAFIAFKDAGLRFTPYWHERNEFNEGLCAAHGIELAEIPLTSKFVKTNLLFDNESWTAVLPKDAFEFFDKSVIDAMMDSKPMKLFNQAHFTMTENVKAYSSFWLTEHKITNHDLFNHWCKPLILINAFPELIQPGVVNIG